MDVHPPHGAIHSWRDFFIHLATITIGLLIALGLEATVEWFHHRHLVAEARENIREEMTLNERHLAENLAEVRANEKVMSDDIKTLLVVREGKKLEHGKLQYAYRWSELGDSAWRAAQNSGAMGYLDFKRSQDLAEVYELQQALSSRNVAMQWDNALALGPLMIGGEPEKMGPEEVQLSLQRTADLAMNLKSMEQLLTQLGDKYKEELGRL